MQSQIEKPIWPAVPFPTLKVGDVVNVAGIDCELKSVSAEARQVAFVPVDPKQKVPNEN